MLSLHVRTTVCGRRGATCHQIGIAASQALDGHSAASSLLLTHAPPLLQLDEASRGSVASSEKAGRGAGSTAGSAATGESGEAFRVRQPGASQGRGRGREVARRGSLLGLAQASAKDDEGQGFGAWKVFIAKWLETSAGS